jgi:hypothetical protein
MMAPFPLDRRQSMPEPRDEPYREALYHARTHATTWLESLPDRPIPPRLGADDVLKSLGESLPDESADPAQAIDQLAAAAEPTCWGAHPAGSSLAVFSRDHANERTTRRWGSTSASTWSWVC